MKRQYSRDTLFIKLTYSLGIHSVDLHWILWEAVRQIEMCGLYVIAVTSDGAASNRRFFRQHWSPESNDGIVYKDNMMLLKTDSIK